MTLAENGFWQFLDQVIGRGSLFLFYAATPLLIGPGEYGHFVILQSTMIILAEPLMSFGLDAVVVKRVVRGNLAAVRSAVVIRTFLLCAVGGLSLAIATRLDADTRVVGLVWLYIGALSIQRLVFSYYRGLEQMKIEGVVGALQKVLVLPLLVLLYELGLAGALLPAAALALSGGGGVIILAYGFGQPLAEMMRRIRQADDRGDWSGVLREGAVLSLANQSSVLYSRVANVMMGFFAGTTAVGMYYVAYRFLEITFIVPTLLMNVIFPRLAKPASATATLRFALVGLAALGLSASVVARLVAKPLIGAIYGDSYAPAATALEILAFAIPPVYVGHLLSQTLIASELQHIYLRLTVVGAIANLGLNLLLIPPYHELGAAVATLATEVMLVSLAAFGLYQSRRHGTHA